MNLLLAALLALPAADPASGQVWPGFRGCGDGITVAKGLPLKWSPTENIAWKIDLPGYGQSCPVVWKDRVFVTAVDGKEREKGFVLAFDAHTGKRLWCHEFAPTQKAKWTYTVSRAAPTPVVDAAGVYAFFEGGDLLALSHEGKPRWSRSLVKDYGQFQNGHGLGSSPAQTEDALIVLIDHRGPSYLLAVDKRTGKTLWKTDRESRSSWTSPVIADQGGKPKVIVSSNGSVCGYNAKTGKLLWALDGVSGNTIPSASVAGDLILFGAGLGRGEKADPEAAAKSNGCLKLVEKDGKPSYEVCWNAKRGLSHYASPLAHHGHAYFVNQVGVVFCHDLKTGEERYAERTAGPCWASPLGAGERVYFFGKDGVTTVLKAGPKFEVLATNRLWSEGRAPGEKTSKSDAAEKQPEGEEPSAEYLDPIVYGVAAVDGTFFFRTGKALYCVRAKE